MSHAPDLWQPHPNEPLGLRLWRLACLATVFLFMAMQLTGGVVRWILDLVGAAPLTYLPNLCMVACIVWALSLAVAYQQLTAGAVLLMALVGLSLTVGIVNTGQAAQVIFGLWVLLPFLFGISCAPGIMLYQPHRALVLALLFGIASIGVLLHSVIEYPWVGVSYQVGGVELEGAREWTTTGGAQRLSGLARSSFDVAGQIVVAAGLLSLRLPSVWVRIVLWGLCIAAVSLSTSKGILLALLMTVIASEALIRNKSVALLLTFVLGIAWLIVPPMMGWTMDWSNESRTDLNNPLYGSFIDRMNDMWPRSLELAHEHGLAFLGRGLGGIGVPLSIFEPDLSNAGDNVFVYCYVLIGALSIPLFVLGFVQIMKASLRALDVDGRDMLVLAVIVNWYGGVSNILEHAVLALAMGIVCRYLAVMMGGRELSAPPIRA